MLVAPSRVIFFTVYCKSLFVLSMSLATINYLKFKKNLNLKICYPLGARHLVLSVRRETSSARRLLGGAPNKCNAGDGVQSKVGALFRDCGFILKMNVQDVCLVPYPGFGHWPGQVVAIMRAGKVRVGLFPHLEEIVECQHDTLKPLPGTAPRPWKKGKKSAFKVRQNF